MWEINTKEVIEFFEYWCLNLIQMCFNFKNLKKRSINERSIFDLKFRGNLIVSKLSHNAFEGIF